MTSFGEPCLCSKIRRFLSFQIFQVQYIMSAALVLLVFLGRCASSVCHQSTICKLPADTWTKWPAQASTFSHTSLANWQSRIRCDAVSCSWLQRTQTVLHGLFLAWGSYSALIEQKTCACLLPLPSTIESAVRTHKLYVVCRFGSISPVRLGIYGWLGWAGTLLAKQPQLGGSSPQAEQADNFHLQSISMKYYPAHCSVALAAPNPTTWQSLPFLQLFASSTNLLPSSD